MLYEGDAPPDKLRLSVAPEQENATSWLEGEDWSGATALFNCLGTTRSKAGGAAGFQHVEVELSRAAAARAHRDGVPHAVCVSAQGANAARWVDPWELIHPLLYQRTLDRKERAMGAGVEVRMAAASATDAW